MKIQIYGSGCDKCQQLYANVETALHAAGIEAELEKVTDMDAIVAAGILLTPALAADGKIVSQGKVRTPDEIAALLKLKTNAAPCGCAGKRPSPAKRLIGLLLLVFVIASVGWAVYREAAARKASVPAPPTPPTATAPIADKALTVYYFHGNQRCPTCRKIEELTRKALDTSFMPALQSGAIVFQSVNLDEPRNEHFIADFGLDSRIVVMQKGAKFIKLPEVWMLVRTPDAFAAYIRDGVEKMQ